MTDVAPLISAALAELTAAHAAQDRAITRLEMALQQAVQRGLQHLPASEALPTDHRRAHRPGFPCRIDADPELKTFIRARIDRLTFAQIADDIASHFPPARRVRSTAIHSWWKREKKSMRGQLS
jgi:hypothetical protein